MDEVGLTEGRQIANVELEFAVADSFVRLASMWAHAGVGGWDGPDMEFGGRLLHFQNRQAGKVKDVSHGGL